MKRKLLLISALFTVFAANAQLTLTNGNVATSATATERLQLVTTTNLKIPVRGAGVAWDYSTMANINGSIDTAAFMVPVNSAFSAATRAYYKTSNLAAFSVKKAIYLTNDVNGYGYVGYSVDSKQSFHLSTGLSDSIIVPVQDSVYAARQFILKYPVAYSATIATWTFSGNLSDHFILDAPSQGSAFVNLRGTRNITHNVTDSVIGWGTLQVPYNNNSIMTASQPYSVILVKEDVTDVTNFYVQGLTSLELQTVLGNLSISQGQSATTSTYIFYRAGYAKPLMSYEVDPSAGYDPDNTAIETGIENENAIINFQAFPNPVTQSTLNFVFNKPDNKEWMMTITNETGQIIQSLLVNQLAGPVQLEVNIPSNLSNGIYFYNMNDGGSSAAQGKFILNR